MGALLACFICAPPVSLGPSTADCLTTLKIVVKSDMDAEN